MKTGKRCGIEARAGATLVELVVSMLIFGIMMVMVVGVLSPAAKLFLRMESLQRARVILDNTVQELCSMADEATGYVKIYPVEAGDVTGMNGADSGYMLEFVSPEGYTALVSAGGCDATVILVGDKEIHVGEAVDDGRLLKRYYTRQPSAGAADQYYWKNDAGEPVARAMTAVFTDRYYMGNKLEVKFSFPSGIGAGSAVPGLEAEVAIYRQDASGNKETVAAEKVTLNFRYEVERRDGPTAAAP